MGPELTSRKKKKRLTIEIKKAGSIVLFEPLTEWASEWWEDNVEDSQMIGGAYAVEHRYAEDIATGITEALT